MPKEEITLESLKAVIDSQNKVIVQMNKEVIDMAFNIKKILGQVDPKRMPPDPLDDWKTNRLGR